MRLDLETLRVRHPLDYHSINLYKWSREGLCTSERISAIEHDSIVGMTIEDLMPLDRNLFPAFLRAVQGEGSSWTSNQNGVHSLNGFFAMNQNAEIIGFSMLVDAQALNFLA